MTTLAATSRLDDVQEAENTLRATGKGEAGMIPALTNHVCQSALFAAVAALLTLALCKNRAPTRHWVLSWHTAPVVEQPRLAFVIEEGSQPFVATMVSAPSAVRWLVCAEGILNICKLIMKSTLASVWGVACRISRSESSRL